MAYRFTFRNLCTQSTAQLLLDSINSWLPNREHRLGTATIPGGDVIGMASRAAAAQCVLFCNKCMLQ